MLYPVASVLAGCTSLTVDNLVIRERQVIMILALETEIVTTRDRCISAFGDQRFVAARDVLAKLCRSTHLVSLGEIRADGEHVAETDARAANRGVRRSNS